MARSLGRNALGFGVLDCRPLLGLRLGGDLERVALGLLLGLDEVDPLAALGDLAFARCDDGLLSPRKLSARLLGRDQGHSLLPLLLRNRDQPLLLSELDLPLALDLEPLGLLHALNLFSLDR